MDELKITASVTTQEGQIKLHLWTLKSSMKNSAMNSEEGEECSSNTAEQVCTWVRCVSHLSETVRLRGAEGLVGQLHQLL